MADFMEYIDQSLKPAVKARQDLERRIIDETVKMLLSRGFVIRVFDGDEFVTGRTTDPGLIQKKIMTTDEDYLFIYRAHEKERIGFVYCVYGNDGYDVLSDYSDFLGPMIEPITEKYS